MSRVKRATTRGLLASLATVLLFTTFGTGSAHASTTSYVWYFTKNYSYQYYSYLGLYQNFSPWGQVGSGFTPGSGHLGHEDECESNAGWIPDGYGAVTGYSWNWGGTSVHGPVLILANKQCYSGKWRTELFVHSQYPWVNPGGYSSAGCIKVSSTSGPSPASGDIVTVVQQHIDYGEPYALGVG